MPTWPMSAVLSRNFCHQFCCAHLNLNYMAKMKGLQMKPQFTRGLFFNLENLLESQTEAKCREPLPCRSELPLLTLLE